MSKHILYDRLCNCKFEERKEILEEFFGDNEDCEIKKNALYSEIYNIMIKKLPFLGLKGFDYDIVANSILIEIDKSKLQMYAEKNCTLQAILIKIATHCAYEEIAIRKGISCNDLQKLVVVNRISNIENIPMEIENAWLFEKLLPDMTMTSIIRAIENYQRTGNLVVNEETDRYLFDENKIW